MKPALEILAILFMVSSGVPAETGDKAQQPAAQQKQAKKRDTAKGETKPKAEANSVPGGAAQSFVIPKNTCESGTTLQKLLTDKPK